jgi:hypothetical protein
MDRYIRYNADAATEDADDPITGEALTILATNPHPRGSMTMCRGQRLYTYNTATAHQLVHQHGSDPFTRQPFSDTDKARVELYYQSLVAFPAYRSDSKSVFGAWMNGWKTGSRDPRLELKARAFLQLEDLQSRFRTFFTDNSAMEIRGLAMVALVNAPVGTWLARKSSVLDSDGPPFLHAMVFSAIDTSGECRHHLYIHKQGVGFFVARGIGRGGAIADAILTEPGFPCVVDVIHHLHATGQLSIPSVAV